MQARESVSLRQVGVGTFFVFRNSVDKLCGITGIQRNRQRILDTEHLFECKQVPYATFFLINSQKRCMDFEKKCLKTTKKQENP